MLLLTYAQIATALHLDDVITLTGVLEEAVHLGTFTGVTIDDSVTIKAAIQALETALELRATLADPTFTGTVTAPAITGALTGNASTATTLASARTIGGVSFNGSANIDPNRGTQGVTEATFVDQDATPDVSNAGTGIHRLFKTANTDAGDPDETTITNFDSGAGDPFEDFNDGDWFILRVEDQYTKIDFSTGTYIQGNAGQDFTGSASNPIDLLFRLNWTSDIAGVWMCETLNSGFSNPTTLAIDKAQFDYNIANPQSITNYDTDDTNYTVGTEITSSVVWIDGINDGDADSIDLQDAGAGYDGMLLTFHTYSDIDINDPLTIAVDEATGCIGCPFGGIFTMYSTGAILSLRWDQGVGWQFVSFYHPPTNWGSSSVSTGFTNDPTPNDTDDIIFDVINDKVCLSVDIQGISNDTDFTFTVPYTAGTQLGSWSGPAMTKDTDDWCTDSWGRIRILSTESVVAVYPCSDLIDGAFTGTEEPVQDKAARGQFCYTVD